MMTNFNNNSDYPHPFSSLETNIDKCTRIAKDLIESNIFPLCQVTFWEAQNPEFFAKTDCLDYDQAMILTAWLATLIITIKLEPSAKEGVMRLYQRKVAELMKEATDLSAKRKGDWAKTQALLETVSAEIEVWEKFSPEENAIWEGMHLLELFQELKEKFPVDRRKVISFRRESSISISEEEEIANKLDDSVANIWHHAVLAFKMLRVSRNIRKRSEDIDTMLAQRAVGAPVRIPVYKKPKSKARRFFVKIFPAFAGADDWQKKLEEQNPELYKKEE